MLKLYRLLSLLMTPVAPLILKSRSMRGKEDPARIGERSGRAGIPRPAGKLIWFHAASMGEATSVLPLIHRLCALCPDLHILMTTVTVTSARNIAPRLPERAFHQFAPLDTPCAVRRFLVHWKPDMALWVESEFWPNMMTATRRTACPMVLLNARISAHSMKKWQRARSMIQELLGCFSLILAKSNEDASRLKNLGAQHVEMLGNLKFSSPSLEADPKIMSEMLAKIGDRPVWLASSTHPGEEEIIAEAHQKLRESYPALLSIIVPRHSRRGAEIRQMLTGIGLRIAQRSTGEAIASDTDIYLADTMGELGIFYRLAGIVFIGGSLVPHGGQNPFEPARLDCAILYGPHMDNFRDFSHELEAAQASLRIQNASDLATRVGDLLRDHERQEALAKAALKAARDTQKVLDKVSEALQPFLVRLGCLPPVPPPDEDAKTPA